MTIDPKPTSLSIITKGKLRNFFGYPIYVPKGHKWVAMDSNGSIYTYKTKPCIRTTCFNTVGCNYEHIAEVTKYTGNWQDSLLKIKDLPKFKTGKTV